MLVSKKMFWETLWSHSSRSLKRFLWRKKHESIWSVYVLCPFILTLSYFGRNCFCSGLSGYAREVADGKEDGPDSCHDSEDPKKAFFHFLYSIKPKAFVSVYQQKGFISAESSEYLFNGRTWFKPNIFDFILLSCETEKVEGLRLDLLVKSIHCLLYF